MTDTKNRQIQLKGTSAGSSMAHAKSRITIGWKETTRLLEKQEFAAALLVAAINVECVLKAYVSAHDKDTDVSKLTMGRCFERIKTLEHKELVRFSDNWQSQVEPVVCLRNKIAHERGFFERVTALELFSEEDVRELIEAARSFCDANPT